MKLQERLEKLEHVFDIITISETWLDPCKSCEKYKLNGYQMHLMDRTSKGGGDAIYIIDKLICKILQLMMFWNV